MGREIVGECSTDPEFGEYGTELIIKYLKQACGPPPQGVDIQVTWEGYEIGNGDETQYPMISVVWDEWVQCPYEYIEKCDEAFERFDLPQETHDLNQDFIDFQKKIQKLFNPD